MTLKNICTIVDVLIVLTLQNSASAQEVKEDKSWIVKLNTTALIDVFSFPTIQFAVEKKIVPYIGVQAEAGIQPYFPQSADTLSVKNSGMRFMAEGRFYIFNYLKKDKSVQRKSDGLYTGIQVFYRKNSYNDRINYYTDESHTTEYQDDFGIKKEVYGMNITFGYQIPFNRFILEPYCYLGFFKRNIKNFNREYNENLGHIENGYVHDFSGAYDLQENSGNAENISVGLRIGYKF